MINLRLFDPSGSKNEKIEFFISNYPAMFLPGLKNLNITVGANNTRKSRFMRSIISVSHKMLFDTPSDLNILIGMSNEVINDLNGISQLFPGGLLRFGIYHATHEAANIVTAYYQKTGAHEKILSCSDFITMINDISNNSYLSTLEENKDEEIKQKIKNLNTLARAARYMFEVLESNNFIVPDKNTYPASDFQYMLENMPNHYVGQTIDSGREVIDVIEKIIEWSSNFETLVITRYTAENLYIPTLRTSRQLSGSRSGMEVNDIFEKTIMDDYFPKDKPNIKIDTGLKLYEQINYARNGNRDDIRNFHAFEKFIGQTFFNSEDIHIIPYRGKGDEKDVIKVSIPNELENIPIHNLGEGVQCIINLLFPIFTAAEGRWIYIDEPENHLHPGYQHIFIQAITQNEFLQKKNLRYFINTHSNHILAESFLSGADTSIFVFSKRDQESSNIMLFEQNEYQTLELLGVMNTSVLITNCSIWVEGITDRFYLRAFLRAYGNSLPKNSFIPKEGYDYSFVEYGGKNLVHYDFDGKVNDSIAAYFINTNVFLLADNDLKKDKHIRYEKIKRPNFRYEQTDLPEIENILPEMILMDFLKSGIGCDGQSVDNIFPMDLSSEKLGTLFSKVTKKGKTVAISSDSGTLTPDYKLKLSQFVHEKIVDGSFTWSDLAVSVPLERITKSLYSFIKSKSRAISTRPN